MGKSNIGNRISNMRDQALRALLIGSAGTPTFDIRYPIFDIRLYWMAWIIAPARSRRSSAISTTSGLGLASGRIFFTALKQSSS